MKKNNIFLFHAVTILYWVTAYNYVPYVTLYLSFLGFTAPVIGLITSMYGFALLICRLPIGIAGDRSEKQKILVIAGMAAGTVGAAGMGLVLNQYLFMIFRLLSGVSIAFWVIFVTVYSSYFDPENTVHPVATMNILASAGRLAAAFLGASTASRYGYRSTFIIAALTGAAGLGCALFIEDTHPADKKSSFDFRDMVDVIHNKVLVRCSILGASIQFIALATVYNFSNTYAKTIGAGEFSLGILQALINVAGMLAPVFVDSRSERRVTAKTQIAVSIALMSLGVLMYIPCKSMLFFCVAHFVIGMGFGSGQVILMAESIRYVEPGKRNTAMGFYQAIYGFGIFLGPLVMGFLVQYLGYAAAFAVIAVYGIVNVIFVLFP